MKNSLSFLWRTIFHIMHLYILVFYGIVPVDGRGWLIDKMSLPRKYFTKKDENFDKEISQQKPFFIVNLKYYKGISTSKMKLIANISIKYLFVPPDLKNISFLIFVSSMFSELCISKKHVSQQQLA